MTVLLALFVIFVAILILLIGTVVNYLYTSPNSSLQRKQLINSAWQEALRKQTELVEESKRENERSLRENAEHDAVQTVDRRRCKTNVCSFVRKLSMPDIPSATPNNCTNTSTQLYCKEESFATLQLRDISTELAQRMMTQPLGFSAFEQITETFNWCMKQLKGADEIQTKQILAKVGFGSWPATSDADVPKDLLSRLALLHKQYRIETLWSIDLLRPGSVGEYKMYVVGPPQSNFDRLLFLVTTKPDRYRQQIQEALHSMFRTIGFPPAKTSVIWNSILQFGISFNVASNTSVDSITTVVDTTKMDVLAQFITSFLSSFNKSGIQLHTNRRLFIEKLQVLLRSSDTFRRDLWNYAGTKVLLAIVPYLRKTFDALLANSSGIQHEFSHTCLQLVGERFPSGVASLIERKFSGPFKNYHRLKNYAQDVNNTFVAIKEKLCPLFRGDRTCSGASCCQNITSVLSNGTVKFGYFVTSDNYQQFYDFVKKNNIETISATGEIAVDDLVKSAKRYWVALSDARQDLDARIPRMFLLTDIQYYSVTNTFHVPITLLWTIGHLSSKLDPMFYAQFVPKLITAVLLADLQVGLELYGLSNKCLMHDSTSNDGLNTGFTGALAFKISNGFFGKMEKLFPSTELEDRRNLFFKLFMFSLCESSQDRMETVYKFAVSTMHRFNYCSTALDTLPRYCLADI